MIIDCFTFNDELDVLEIRLNELYDSVDHFVLVEASKTQSLKDKPLFFEMNKNRFSKFLDKIIHIKITEYPQFFDLWGMENFQRNQIIKGIEQLTLNDEDIILISDLDEIPSKEAILHIKQSKLDVGCIAMKFSAYYMNFIAKRKWIGTVYVKMKHFKTATPQFYRGCKDRQVPLNNDKVMGWHLSWLGGPKKVWEKAHSCIEPYDKSKIIPLEEFTKQFNDLIERKSFIHIENLNQKGEDFIIEDFDSKEYPKEICNNFWKYKRYFFNTQQIEKKEIKIYASGLSDLLTYTPLYRTGLDIKICLKDADQERRLAPIFKNMFDVEIRNDVHADSLTGDHNNLPVSKSRLYNFGYPNSSCIPLVLLDQDEIKTGYDLIKQYKNPVAIVINTANNDQNRNISNIDLWVKMCNFFKKEGYTPIQFGLSKNLNRIPDIEYILDLPIRQLAAVYYNIGRYIGVETGDSHLMIAVGGKTTVIYPNSQYNKRYQYPPSEWKNDTIRARYIDIKDLCFDKILF